MQEPDHAVRSALANGVAVAGIEEALHLHAAFPRHRDEGEANRLVWRPAGRTRNAGSGKTPRGLGATTDAVRHFGAHFFAHRAELLDGLGTNADEVNLGVVCILS